MHIGIKLVNFWNRNMMILSQEKLFSTMWFIYSAKHVSMTSNASIVGFIYTYSRYREAGLSTVYPYILTFHIMFIEIDIEEERKKPCVNVHASGLNFRCIWTCTQSIHWYCISTLHKENTKVFLTIATYHSPFQNFNSVTSSSTSSNACTLSCLGVRVMRYGSGLRDDSPLYPSREMGSSGSDRISNAQSNRDMAKHSSLSATWIAGQIRRLRPIRTKKVSEEKKGRRLAERRKHIVTYPAPNAQWSRSIALGRLLDSAQVNASPRKRSGLKVNLS